MARPALARALLGGAGSALGRARLINGQTEVARRSLDTAVALNPQAGDRGLVSGLRLDSEAHRLAEACGGFLKPPAKTKVFVDCGGYDGCSAIMFLMKNPDFDCITFEPNPALWDYYRDIPNILHKKAVYTYDGKIDLMIDPIDGDGSSVVAGKRIDFTKQIADQDCPVLRVPCVDLARVLLELAAQYQEIVLKLDVEGAKYDILERLFETSVIDKISRLYCEFHGHKMNLENDRHAALMKKLENRVETAFWDALPFSFDYANTEKEKTKRRAALLNVLRATTLPAKVG